MVTLITAALSYTYLNSDYRKARVLGFPNVGDMHEAFQEGYTDSGLWQKIKKYESKKKEWRRLKEKYEASLETAIPRGAVLCSDLRSMFKASILASRAPQILQLRMPDSCDYAPYDIPVDHYSGTFYRNIMQIFSKAGVNFFASRSDIKQKSIGLDLTSWGIDASEGMPTLEQYAGKRPSSTEQKAPETPKEKPETRKVESAAETPFLQKYTGDPSHNLSLLFVNFDEFGKYDALESYIRSIKKKDNLCRKNAVSNAERLNCPRKHPSWEANTDALYKKIKEIASPSQENRLNINQKAWLSYRENTLDTANKIYGKILSEKIKRGSAGTIQQTAFYQTIQKINFKICRERLDYLYDIYMEIEEEKNQNSR